MITTAAKPAIIFDTETGPLPADELAKAIPPFDPASVKLGNTKDPDKIAAKIAESKAEYETESVSKAALDALTGRVLAVGYFHAREQEFDLHIHDGTANGERKLLVAFWAAVSFATGGSATLVGHNIHGFDLPFLIQRSRLLGVSMPPLGELLFRNRYWAECFVDTMQNWNCGKYNAYTSLDRLAKAFGLGGKNGSGADFAGLWETDRSTAEAYLKNDLELTYRVAMQLGVC